MILPDTSVWIDFFGRRTRPQSALLFERLKKKSRIFICGPVLQEVLQGTRNDQAFGRVRKQLDAMAWAATADARFTAVLAARLHAQLRWRGVTIRSANDCLIACIAIEHGLTLLHDDADFEKIAAIEPRLKLA